jgi:hypothetical protein
MSTYKVSWLNECTERLGEAIREVRALRKDLGPLPIEVTDPLHAAFVRLEDAQRALTYELGVAARVEYANRPRAASSS